MAKDFYDILGVSRTASEQDIKSAYLRKAREYHPDLNPGDKEAEAKFKEVQQAYDVLGDKEKRAQYDQFGAGFEQFAGGPRGGAGGPFTFRWSRGPGGMGGAEGFDFTGAGPFMDLDLEELLRQASGERMGGRARTGRRRRTAPPEEVSIDVDFMTAARGGSVEFRLQRADDGAESKTIRVDIPAGIHEGAALRLRGQGADGGDLHLRVHILPHPFFEREGQDVRVQAPISVSEAVLGCKLDVPTIDGMITLTIPPGTSSGQRLRLRERGLPTPGKSTRGDQYVEVKVIVPRSVDARSKELMEEFARRNPENPRAGLRWNL
jgi:DnaJ-class molecular chaperone